MDSTRSAAPTDPTPLTLAPDDRVDLHLHTLASDGAWTPAALIDHLAGQGFRVVAVCDHDSQRSVAEATRLGAARGIRVIPGVEVTTRWADRQWHLLVYGVAPGRRDPNATAFQALLTELDALLQNAAVDARLRIERSGRALPSLDGVLAGRPMWPFHVLSAAIADKHAENLKQAADLVTELGGTFTADLPLARVVTAAHEAGGVCVMAHPGRADSVGVMTEADLEHIRRFIPLDGLEAHYRSYSDAQTAEYRAMAERHGLLISCGSDSHAPGAPVDPRPWQAAWCADLLTRLGVRVEPVPDGDPIWAPGMDALAVVPTPDPPPAGSDAVGETDPASGQAEPAGEQLMEAAAEREGVGTP